MYVIGMKGLEEELDAVGVAHCGGSVSRRGFRVGLQSAVVLG